MPDKIEIDYLELYTDLMNLLEVAGPTQACVKISEHDPRIDGLFPIEEAIEKIVEKFNKENNLHIQIIRHNGNLIVIGGFEEKYDKIRDASTLSQEEIKNIRNIPVIFGAHLDEICYIIRNAKGFLDGENYKVVPLCAPPKIPNSPPIFNEDNTAFAQKIYHPDCRIVGFRNGKFYTDIATGHLYRVEKIEKEEEEKSLALDGKEHSITKKNIKVADYLILKILTVKDKEKIMPGDIVIQDYGDWKEKKRCSSSHEIITSKAIDDRLGCIAVLYVIRELAKKKIKAKAILTSSEEGVPVDNSWGRLIRPSYDLFCENKVITLICDGTDGLRLVEFNEYTTELSHAIIVPYTSNGKGGGDIGIFSRFRDNIIPTLNKIYDEDVAKISTDYSSRSYDVKILDDWTLMGFVQWSCGKPLKRTAICHNNETVCLYQAINIIRTFYYAFEFFSEKSN